MGELIDSELARTLARIDRVSELMDSRYRIPLVNVRLGWDAIGGLVPVAGDMITTAVSVWLVLEARKFEAGNRLILRMAGNVAADTLISAIPFAGSVLDVFFRANERNLALLLKHIEADLEARKACSRRRRKQGQPARHQK